MVPDLLWDFVEEVSAALYEKTARMEKSAESTSALPTTPLTCRE